MTIGIIDILYRPLDPVDRAPGKLEREAGASPRCEAGNAIKHAIHPGCPAGRLMIIDKTARPRRAVDHLAQARTDGLVILVDEGGGGIELAEQAWILLDQLHNHL